MDCRIPCSRREVSTIKKIRTEREGTPSTTDDKTENLDLVCLALELINTNGLSSFGNAIFDLCSILSITMSSFGFGNDSPHARNQQSESYEVEKML